MTASRWLSPGQLAGLQKAGDILAPGDHDFPSFSESGAIAHVDRLLDHLHPADRDGVRLVLGAFRFLPRLAVRAVLALAEHDRRLPGPLGVAARQVRLGVKGVVMTLYYSDVGSGRSVHGLIGWDARVAVPAGNGSEAGHD